MAKSKRKAGGCTHGRFKLKKMGKGWATHRRTRGRPLPIVRSEGAVDEGESTRRESDDGGKAGESDAR